MPQYKLPIKMPHKTLTPGVGIEVEDLGKVDFGMTLDQVEEILGRPNLEDMLYLHYDHLGIRMEHENGIIKRFFFGKSGNISLYNVDPLKLKEQTLTDLLKTKNSNQAKVNKQGNTYYFTHIGISLWKNASPDGFNLINLVDKDYFEMADIKWQIDKCVSI